MVIKLLHLADLHLGARAYERWEGGKPVRLAEAIAALDWAWDLARRENVHAVVVAGDIYDHYRAEPFVQAAWAACVAGLRADGLPLVVVAGNHDRPGRAPNVTGQDLFAALALRGVYVATAPALWEVPTAAGPIMVAALPWRFSGPPSAVREAGEEIKRLLAETWAPRLQEGLPAVCVGHLWLAGGRLSSENAIIGDESQLVPGDVTHDAFAYYALGHLHMHQEVATGPGRGPAVYAGSLTRLNFADEGVAKGAVIVELDGARARWRFVGGPARDFVTLALGTVKDLASFNDALREKAARARRDYGDAVVRVRAQGPAGLAAEINAREVAGFFAGAWDIRLEFSPLAIARRRDGVAPESDLRAALAAYLAHYPPPFAAGLDELVRRARELGVTPPRR